MEEKRMQVSTPPVAEGTPIKMMLGDICEEFAETCRDAFHSMFQTEPAIEGEWSVVPKMDGRFEYIFYVASGNAYFRTIMRIGISISSIEQMVGFPLDLAEAKDAFGEFANVLCAVVQDNPRFVETVGFLKQEPPEDAVHQAFFPKGFAIQGRLAVGSSWLSIGYAIFENLLTMDGDSVG